jgi:hypothetical protein
MSEKRKEIAAIKPKKSKAGKRSPKLSPKLSPKPIQTVADYRRSQRAHPGLDSPIDISVVLTPRDVGEKVYCKGCKYLMTPSYILYRTDDLLDHYCCTHPVNTHTTYKDTPLVRETTTHHTRINTANAKNDCALREELPVKAPPETNPAPQPAPTLTFWQKIAKMFQHNTKG